MNLNIPLKKRKVEILQVNIQRKFTSRGIVFLSSTLPVLILSIISDIAFMRGSSLELDLPDRRKVHVYPQSVIGYTLATVCCSYQNGLHLKTGLLFFRLFLPELMMPTNFL